MNERKPLLIVRSRIRERMNELADALSTGNAKDYAEYKSLCGQIHGLATAERELLDLAETMEKAENE